MRLLWVVPRYGAQVVGGAERHVRALVRRTLDQTAGQSTAHPPPPFRPSSAAGRRRPCARTRHVFLAGRAGAIPRGRRAAGRVKTINQVVSSVTPADAVTDQVLAWRRVFQRWGFQSEIVAGEVHQDLRGLVHRLGRRRRGAHRQGLGRPPLHDLVWCGGGSAPGGRPPRALVSQRNAGDLLRPFNPGTAALCDQARRALTNFKGRFDALIAVSSFNAADLVKAGLGPVEVVPLLLDVTRVTPRAPETAAR